MKLSKLKQRLNRVSRVDSKVMGEVGSEGLGVDDEVYREYVKGVYDTVFSVLKRSLFIVERFAQAICVDLSDRGLGVNMTNKVLKTEEGVSLVIHFEVDRESILEAVKNVRFRKEIKKMEKEIQRMRKGRIKTGYKRRVYEA